jgi:hypothetical protein
VARYHVDLQMSQHKHAASSKRQVNVKRQRKGTACMQMCSLPPLRNSPPGTAMTASNSARAARAALGSTPPKREATPRAGNPPSPLASYNSRTTHVHQNSHTRSLYNRISSSNVLSLGWM